MLLYPKEKLISERFPDQMTDRKKKEKSQDLPNNLFSHIFAHSGIGQNALL